MSQAERAELFQALHRTPEMLVLPNAWDAGSAVIFEKAGFRAIGSTSAGIAYSLGYPDGEKVPFDEMLAVQERIVRRIGVPFSMDIETGFGSGIAEVRRIVEQVVSAGAVGINVEDGRNARQAHLVDLQFQCELLREIVRFRDGSAVPFVINARTDSFWLGLGSPADALRESVERANAYLDAGADCAFVPGNLGRETIEALVREVHGPLNVIAAPNTPAPKLLEEMGVARLSLGSGPARASLATVREIAQAVRGGSLGFLESVALSYAEANSLMSDTTSMEDAGESRR